MEEVQSVKYLLVAVWVSLCMFMPNLGGFSVRKRYAEDINSVPAGIRLQVLLSGLIDVAINTIIALVMTGSMALLITKVFFLNS